MATTLLGLIMTSVQNNVEVVAKIEQEIAQTLLHNMVEKIVLDHQKNLNHVTHSLVQVS